MKLELYKCDRCENDIRVPEERVFIIKYSEKGLDPGFLETWELCHMCYEAVVLYLQGQHIPSGLAGIIKHEEKVFAEEEEDDH